MTTMATKFESLPEAVAITERVQPLPAAVIRRAQRVVAGHAESTEDCRELLRMLGIQRRPKGRDKPDSGVRASR